MSKIAIDDIILNSLSLCHFNIDKQSTFNINACNDINVKYVYRTFSMKETELVFDKYNPEILIISIVKATSAYAITFIKALRKSGNYKAVIVLIDELDIETGIDLLKFGVEETIIGGNYEVKLKDSLIRTIKKYASNTALLCGKNHLDNYFSEQMKSDLKKLVRTLMCSYLKLLYGVGPKIVAVKCENGKMCIEIHDCFTVYEKNLIAGGIDKSLISSLRFFMYSKKKESIENGIYEITSLKTSLIDIKVNPDKLVEELVFNVSL